MQKAFKRNCTFVIGEKYIEIGKKKEAFIEKTFYFPCRTGCYRKEYSINACKYEYFPSTRKYIAM